jgi:hypothetical protein
VFKILTTTYFALNLQFIQEFVEMVHVCSTGHKMGCMMKGWSFHLIDGLVTGLIIGRICNLELWTMGLISSPHDAYLKVMAGF